MSDPRGHRRYVKNNQQLMRTLPPYCSWCGDFIDLTLHFNDPLACTTDHTVALADGGDLYGERTLMHRKCNAEKEGQRRRQQTDGLGRMVVLLCGPSGAGKTTAAHESGLQVFDRDDKQWQTEAQFTTALKVLGSSPTARAVVIRAGATSSARARASALINATHTYLVVLPREELARRISKRGRADAATTHAALNTWFERHDLDDQCPTFPGWDAVPEVAETPLRTTRKW